MNGELLGAYAVPKLTSCTKPASLAASHSSGPGRLMIRGCKDTVRDDP